MTPSNSPATERETVLLRVFDALSKLVWSTWTEREHVEQLWGPNGFRTADTRHEPDPVRLQGRAQEGAGHGRGPRR